MNFRVYREFFRALANQTRFSIVQLLRTGPYNVGEIGEKLGFEQSRISHNLGCLLNCGFVQWAWQGRNKVYRLHPDLEPILAAMDQHLARYAPALQSCGVLEAESRPVVIVRRGNSPAHRRPRRDRKSLGGKR